VTCPLAAFCQCFDTEDQQIASMPYELCTVLQHFAVMVLRNVGTERLFVGCLWLRWVVLVLQQKETD
jgi:hypothetical protein